MISKKKEIKVDGEIYQLWFNNYAMFEMASMYGVDQRDIMKRVSERLSDNFLLLIGDLFWAGYKGAKLALNKPAELTREQINEIVAIAPMDDLFELWEIFKDVNGMNEPVEEDKKKAIKKKVKK